MQNFSNILILAFLVQEIFNQLKPLWNKDKFCWEKLGVLLLSIIIAIFTNQDLFLLIKLPFDYAIIGQIFTGILISGGASTFFDLIKGLKEVMNTSALKNLIVSKDINENSESEVKENG